jgi:RimJ/RimL family protein N-acetyltransferase
MSRSDHATGQISTYRFPEEVSIDTLLVRGPLDADIEEIAPAFRDPAVGGEAGLPPVDADTLRVIMREQLPGMRAQGLLAAYVIEDTKAGQLLGGASLHHFDPLRDVVEIGYWLFVEARGLGVATRVVRKLTEHAFRGGIWRVEAHVRVGNTASERVLERLDFVREGVKRRYLRHAGGRVDATLFALLADDA